MAIAEKTAKSARAEITGRHVLIMFLAFFAVIIAVNVALAWRAIATFPGLEVPNSYVASQTFDVERSAQIALGWTLTPSYGADDGTLRLAFTDAQGRALAVSDLQVLVGRTTQSADDLAPVFTLQDGAYVAPVDLGSGIWMMAVSAHAADGTLFRQRLNLRVVR
ncbi:MAG: FixH family protein [Paracoccaceae bacterium]